MNYNDYATLTPKDYQILKENYEKVQSQGFNDLNEIIIKLKEQKSNLMQDDKKYLHIIPRLQEGIDSLEKIESDKGFDVILEELNTFARNNNLSLIILK